MLKVRLIKKSLRKKRKIQLNKSWFCSKTSPFALTIIDRQEGERRPFTQDGKRVPELSPADAMHNELLDLKDIYAEVGVTSPYR